jgi:hypothetical protein
MTVPYLMMWTHEMSKLTFAIWSIVLTCALIVTARPAHAGSERISLTGGGATTYQSGVSSVIPITVQLANGQPDHIDMTYYATDSTGAAVQVSPTSNRFYLTHLQSATDNVVVTLGSAQYNVTFVALAEGECVGADGESYTQVLTTIGNQSRRTARATVPTSSGAGTLTLTSSLIDDQRTAPVMVSLDTGIATVRLTYTAVDSSGQPRPVTCRPKAEDVSVAGAVTGSSPIPARGSLRSVLVDVGANGGNAFTPPFKLSVMPSQPHLSGLTAATNNNIDSGNDGSLQNNTVNQTTTATTTPTATLGLTVKASTKLNQWKITSNFTPFLSGNVKLYYSAPDLQTGVCYHCDPYKSKHDGVIGGTALPPETIIVDLTDLPAGHTATFIATAIDKEGNVSVNSTTMP